MDRELDRLSGRDTNRFCKLEKKLEFSLERGGTDPRIEFSRIYLFGWKYTSLLQALLRSKQNCTYTSLSSSEEEGERGVNCSFSAEDKDHTPD